MMYPPSSSAPHNYQRPFYQPTTQDACCLDLERFQGKGKEEEFPLLTLLKEFPLYWIPSPPIHPPVATAAVVVSERWLTGWLEVVELGSIRIIHSERVAPVPRSFPPLPTSLCLLLVGVKLIYSVLSFAVVQRDARHFLALIAEATISSWGREGHSPTGIVYCVFDSVLLPHNGGRERKGRVENGGPWTVDCGQRQSTLCPLEGNTPHRVSIGERGTRREGKEGSLVNSQLRFLGTEDVVVTTLLASTSHQVKRW